MMLNRLRRADQSSPVGDEESRDTPREKIPTWFILETMAAVMTIGSLLLDLRHKSRSLRMARHQAAVATEGK
jgi:predicted hotdog family 3-hydroxylacyl-ACP dehydratase